VYPRRRRCPTLRLRQALLRRVEAWLQAGPPALRRLVSPATLLSFLVAGAFLYFLTARFEIDLGATLRSIRQSHPGLYLLALLAYYASFPVRGLRWRLMACNAAEDPYARSRVPSAWECGLFILIGWFVNSIGWLRMGDAYRSYLFAERGRLPLLASLGIVLAERVLDVVSIFLLLVTATLWLGMNGSGVPSALFLLVGLGMLLVGLAGLGFMFFLGPSLARHLLTRPLQSAYEVFHRHTFRSLRGLPVMLALGLGGWALETLRLALVVKALGLMVPAPLVLFIALVHAILTTVPITPGGLGLAEPGMVGLLVLALPRDSAVAVALLDRSITYLSVVALGGLAFLGWQGFALRRRVGGPS